MLATNKCTVTPDLDGLKGKIKTCCWRLEDPKASHRSALQKESWVAPTPRPSMTHWRQSSQSCKAGLQLPVGVFNNLVKIVMVCCIIILSQNGLDLLHWLPKEKEDIFALDEIGFILLQNHAVWKTARSYAEYEAMNRKV
jgi:hypothetical protein